MKIYFKILCLFTSAILALTLFTGCAPENRGVEITVATPFDNNDGNRENFVRAYKAYEADTGNTVIDIASSSNEEWKKKIMADFESGAEPDVLFYFTGRDADALVSGNKVTPIGDIRKVYPDYAANMKDSMMPVSTSDGLQYAVPVNGYWEGLFVNKKVLEACGVSLPGALYTWSQFLEDCQIIKEHGYTPIACSLFEVPHYWFEYTTLNHGGMLNHVALPASSQDATGSVWSAGLWDIKELYDKGFFPEDTNTQIDKTINLMMTENRAAFMIDGSWKVGWFQENAGNIDDFMVTYVPSGAERKATDIIGGISMGYYITKKAWNDPKKRDACVKFIAAMTTDEVVSSFGALSVTALKNGTRPPDGADSLVMSALAMTKDCTGVVSAAQDRLLPVARKKLFDSVSSIVTGVLTPEAAIDSCLAVG